LELVRTRMTLPRMVLPFSKGHAVLRLVSARRYTDRARRCTDMTERSAGEVQIRNHEPTAPIGTVSIMRTFHLRSRPGDRPLTETDPPCTFGRLAGGSAPPKPVP